MNTVQQVSENLKKKIKKLFALAGNNPSQEEAQSALLKAQELMAQHGIEMTEIEGMAQQEQKKEVEHGEVANDGKLDWWEKSLANVIANNFRCFLYWRTRKKVSMITFLGIKEDVSIAKEVYSYARLVLEHSAKDYVKNWKRQFLYEKPSAQESMNAKNAFIQGFIEGLRAKFQEQVDKNGWGLVLVKDALVTKEHDSMKIRRETIGKGINRSGNAEAKQAGYQEGKRFDASRKRI